MELANGRVDAVDLGHAHVHEDHVGGQFLGLGHRFLAVLGLSDHLDAILGAEHHVQPPPEQGLVVCDEDADDLVRRGVYVGHEVPLVRSRR